MLQLKQINLHLGDFNLNNISFTVNRGEYFVLVGASGAGKSLILETIAGLIFPDKGNILLNDRDITYEKIYKRKVGLVFQDHTVFPHMTVKQNIAYSLHSRTCTLKQKEETIKEISNRLNISNLLNRKPGTLSGGELQRVALARTMVQQPDILLLDEPLASIDVLIKSELRELLRKINLAGQTIIHVTHDYNEAVSLANRIAVLHNGTIQQIGTPKEIFIKPASQFIAELSGVRNFYRAQILEKSHSATNGVKSNKVKSNNSYDKESRYHILLNDKVVVTTSSPGNHLSEEFSDKSGYYIIPQKAISLHIHEEMDGVNIFEGTIIDIIRLVNSVELKIDIGIPLIVEIAEIENVEIGGVVKIVLSL